MSDRKHQISKYIHDNSTLKCHHKSPLRATGIMSFWIIAALKKVFGNVLKRSSNDHKILFLYHRRSLHAIQSLQKQYQSYGAILYCSQCSIPLENCLSSFEILIFALRVTAVMGDGVGLPAQGSWARVYIGFLRARISLLWLFLQYFLRLTSVHWIEYNALYGTGRYIERSV